MQIEARKGGASLPWAHLRLPPFPQVAIHLLRLANDENVQLHHLSDLISSDPAFAAEVLTIANSSQCPALSSQQHSAWDCSDGG